LSESDILSFTSCFERLLTRSSQLFLKFAEEPLTQKHYQVWRHQGEQTTYDTNYNCNVSRYDFQPPSKKGQQNEDCEAKSSTHLIKQPKILSRRVGAALPLVKEWPETSDYDSSCDDRPQQTSVWNREEKVPDEENCGNP
jgi:hypothetical protein